MPAINTVALGNHPIQIPSDFPGILKQYTKAAIRTQPRDLLLWSAAYFRCLARGEPPPAKDRLEYPVPQTDTGEIKTKDLFQKFIQNNLVSFLFPTTIHRALQIEICRLKYSSVGGHI